MRVERLEEKPKFVPVHLVLETQEEIDTLFAILDWGPVANAMRASGIGTWWERLSAYKSGAYSKMLDHLSAQQR